MKLNFYFFCILIIFVSSCSMGTLRKSGATVKNLREIEKLNTLFQVTEVKSSEKKMRKILQKKYLSCRGGSVNLPEEQNLSQLILETLNEEFVAANKFSEKGEKVEVDVRSVELDAWGIFKGYWNINMNYKLNQHNIIVETITPYESSYFGDKACFSAITSFYPALQENLFHFYQELHKRNY